MGREGGGGSAQTNGGVLSCRGSSSLKGAVLGGTQGDGTGQGEEA